MRETDRQEKGRNRGERQERDRDGRGNDCITPTELQLGIEQRQWVSASLLYAQVLRYVYYSNSTITPKTNYHPLSCEAIARARNLINRGGGKGRRRFDGVRFPQVAAMIAIEVAKRWRWLEVQVGAGGRAPSRAQTVTNRGQCRWANWAWHDCKSERARAPHHVPCLPEVAGTCARLLMSPSRH